MKIMTAYGVGIKHYNHILKDSVRIYRDAVDFLIEVCLKEWDSISVINGLQSRCIYVESLVHKTKKRPVVPYDFDHEFYKFPSYLLRSAICCALGKASSYLSNLENWKNADAKCKGQQPGYPKAGFVFPCLYKGNMYLQTGDYEFQIKVYIRNTWDWIPVQVNIHDYPNGSIVSVVYAITKRGRVQVYLADRLPADKSSMSKVFNIISVISLIITLGLILAGVMTTLF